MKWFREFLKRRKQDDRVKVMLLFTLLGMVLLGNGIYRIVKIYDMVMESSEYILEENETMQIKDSKIEELLKTENVVAVSRQKEIPLVLKGGSENVSLDCIGLSEDYLKSSYGINITSSMKVFYVNKAAYDILVQSEEFAEELKKNPDGIIAEYILGEEGTICGTAKVILVKNGIPNDVPCAFYKAERAELSGDTSGVRVWFSKEDLTGMNEKKLTDMGVTIANRDAIYQRNLLYELQFVHIRYSVFGGIICFVFVLFTKLTSSKNP